MNWIRAVLICCLFVTLSQANEFMPIGANLESQDIIFPTPQDNTHFSPDSVAVVGWLISTTLDTGIVSSNHLIMDYLKMIEYDPETDQEEVIYFEHYNNRSGMLRSSEGGQYPRLPSWFVTDEHSSLSNSWTTDGFLRINIGQKPDSIAHWWTSRVLTKPNCWYYLEVKIKITAGIGVQFGLDFWIHPDSSWQGLNVNNTESWHSDWYGDTDGKFVTIRSPITFKGGEDYGVTLAGEYFISQRFVDFASNPYDRASFIGEVIDWDEVPMTFNGQHYTWQAEDSVSNQVYYCFKSPSGYIPPLAMNALVTLGDLISNGYGGYNFCTWPTEEIIIRKEPVPEPVKLNQNYPNPFNETTTLSYFLMDISQVSIIIYDIQGKKIKTLLDQLQGGGLHQVLFQNSSLTSGRYIYCLQTDNFTKTKLMVLVK